MLRSLSLFRLVILLQLQGFQTISHLPQLSELQKGLGSSLMIGQQEAVFLSKKNEKAYEVVSTKTPKNPKTQGWQPNNWWCFWIVRLGGWQTKSLQAPSIAWLEETPTKRPLKSYWLKSTRNHYKHHQKPGKPGKTRKNQEKPAKTRKNHQKPSKSIKKHQKPSKSIKKASKTIKKHQKASKTKKKKKLRVSLLTLSFPQPT